MADKKKEPVKAEEKPVEQPVDGTPQGKTIDERMADLLKDHQAMGARPK